MAHRQGSKVIVKRKQSLEAMASYRDARNRRLRLYASDNPRGFDGLGQDMLELLSMGLHLPTIEDVQKALAPLGFVCPSCRSRQAPGAYIYSGAQTYCLGCIEDKTGLCSDLADDALKLQAYKEESRLYVESVLEYCHPGLWPIWLHSKARNLRAVRCRLSNSIAKLIKRFARGSCAGRWWRRKDRLTGDIYAEHNPCPYMDDVGKELLIKGTQSFTFSRAGGQCLRCATFEHNYIARKNLGHILCHQSEQLRARVLCEGMLFAASLVVATERIVAPYFDCVESLDDVLMFDGRVVQGQKAGYRLKWPNYSQADGKTLTYDSTTEADRLLAEFWL